jgi:hydroxymethylglutaryl-CoA synthase
MEVSRDSRISVKQHLMKLFASVENTDLEGGVSTSSSSALFNAINWIESSSWDGRYAVVFAGDIFPSASQVNVIGINCVMLIGPNAPIVVERALVPHSSEFCTRSLSFNWPASHGSHVDDAGSAQRKSSADAYTTALQQAYAHWQNKYHKSPKAGPANAQAARPSIASFDYMMFQPLSYDVAQRAYSKLVSSTWIVAHFGY